MITIILGVLILLTLVLRICFKSKGSVSVIYRITRLLGIITYLSYTLFFINLYLDGKISLNLGIHPYYIMYVGMIALFLFLSFGISILGRTSILKSHK